MNDVLPARRPLEPAPRLRASWAERELGADLVRDFLLLKPPEPGLKGLKSLSASVQSRIPFLNKGCNKVKRKCALQTVTGNSRKGQQGGESMFPASLRGVGVSLGLFRIALSILPWVPPERPLHCDLSQCCDVSDLHFVQAAYPARISAWFLFGLVNTATSWSRGLCSLSPLLCGVEWGGLAAIAWISPQPLMLQAAAPFFWPLAGSPCPWVTYGSLRLLAINFYGISGASSDDLVFAQNQSYLEDIFVFAAQFALEVPVLIAEDFQAHPMSRSLCPTFTSKAAGLASSLPAVHWWAPFSLSAASCISFFASKLVMGRRAPCTCASER